MLDFSNWKRQQIHINGTWSDADSGETFSVSNPATGQEIGTVPNAGSAEAHRAIDAAAAAYPGFAAMSLADRVALLWRMHDLVMENQTALAELLTEEMGKPLPEAMGEVAIGAQYLRWYAEEVRRAKGEVVPPSVNGRRILVTKHPIGVVGMITPWNFPSSMLARKLGPALAVGCTVVAKPAPDTPYSGLAWAALAEAAGYAPGVVNILTGDAASIAQAMMEREEVRKITFTGSTEVGRKLLRGAADSVKKVSMELGGNAPFVVFDDADLDAAVDGAMASKYRNAGQTCVCANRIYVQSGIHDAFVEKLVEKSNALKVGNGMDDGVNQGPLINDAALKKVETLLQDAVEKGAKIEAGGARHALGGTFFQPTVLSGATKDMAFAKAEIFGPLAPVFKFETEEEAIRLANDTIYGLAAYCYTNDIGRAFRLNEGLEYGMIGINAGVITSPEAPFGGIKQSGLGKEGGSQGLEDYLDTKYMCIDGI